MVFSISFYPTKEAQKLKKVKQQVLAAEATDKEMIEAKIKALEGVNSA